MSTAGARLGGAPRPGDVVSTSPGVLLSPFAAGALAFDAIAETTHLLDPVAAWLVAAGADGPISVGDLVDDAVGATGTDRAAVAADLATGIDALRALGLIDRAVPYDPPAALVGASGVDPTWATGGVHAVLDHGIAFHAPDPALLATIDEFLGTALDDRAETIPFAVEALDDGGVLLRTDDEWRFPHLETLFAQLPGVVNEYASRSDGRAVLHAGAVRTPDGRIVLIPGEVDAGKSTVVGALVQAGCDYLGDEAIALRPGEERPSAVAYPKPLTLDATSREVLGLAPSSEPHLAPEVLRPDVVRLCGDHGPIDHLLLPRYRGPVPADPARSEEPSTTRLTPSEAVRVLLSHTLNLGRAGEEGLASIAALAETVPATRIVHLGSRALADAVVRGDVAGPPNP